MMHAILPASDPQTWGSAIDEAVAAVQRGAVVVLPTDTVYGVGADAFSPEAVAAVLAAKGRGRQMPPPVLVPDARTLDGLATDVPDEVRALVEEFWPGGLTIICRAQPTLAWDLGETHGTVALRMPDHPTALALLRRTGPLAVTSANRTGEPAALDVAEAAAQLGGSVQVYLDGGRVPGGVASTIVDATRAVPVVVREGAVPLTRLREVVPGLLGPGEEPATGAASGTGADTAAGGPAAKGGTTAPDDPR